MLIIGRHECKNVNVPNKTVQKAVERSRRGVIEVKNNYRSKEKAIEKQTHLELLCEL